MQSHTRSGNHTAAPHIRRARRRRRIAALILAAALIAPLVVIAEAVDAHPPPTPPDPDPDMVSDTGARDAYFYYWVDTATRTVELGDDFVRLERGGSETVYVRDNDAIRFDVCRYTAELTEEADLRQCRQERLGKPAGGTCGDAVRHENDPDAPAVLGHHHVLAVCTNITQILGANVGVVDGGRYATAGTAPGAITEDYADGYHPSGAVLVTGLEYGEARARYCLTRQPYSCRSWADLTILVEPDGWADARVAGAPDKFRLGLNWETRLTELWQFVEDDDGIEVEVSLTRICCLTSLNHWSFTVRLPVIDNDEVVFLDGDGVELGRTKPCLLRYCDNMAPGSPEVRSDGGLDLTNLGVYGDSIVATISGEALATPTTATVEYCVRYGLHGCGPSQCARATYLGAPNAGVPDWSAHIPPATYRATEHCPPHGKVEIEVADITPDSFERDLADFDDPDWEVDPDLLDDVEIDVTSSVWLYRPQPAANLPDPLPDHATLLALWCYPDIENVTASLTGTSYEQILLEAGTWVQAMYDADPAWPSTGLASHSNNTRFLELSARQEHDLNNDGVADLTWGPLSAGVSETEDEDNPGVFSLGNAADLAAELLVRHYELAYHGHWDGPDPWSGLVTSEYRQYIGLVEEVHPFLPVGRRLVVTGPVAQQNTCLETEPRIVAVWGTHPGITNSEGGTPLATWGDGLCGVSWEGGVGEPDPGVSEWAYFDHQCPLDPLDPLDPADPDDSDTPVPPARSWLSDVWVDWEKPPRDSSHPPWTLGEEWERALENVVPCLNANACDAWAPQIPGFYQVRFEITKPSAPPPASEPVTRWHYLYLKRRFSADLVDPDRWRDLGSSGGTCPSDGCPPILFDDLVWVAPLRLTGFR